MRESSLARFLLLATVLLVAYATLHPLSGWRDPGATPFAFLAAPWPRYLTGFDLAANFAGYVPYGFLFVLAVRPGWPAATAVAFALASGGALSLALEAAQSFLPARIPSQADVLANVAGVAAGALAGAVAAPRLLGGGALRRARIAVLESGTWANLGLTLLGLWLFAQLNPATLLFGAGDLRDLVAAPAGERHGAGFFIAVECAVATANLLAVTLLGSALARPGAPLRALLAGLLAAALAVRTLAFAVLMQAEHALVWLTPGAQLGLVCGAGLALAALALPRGARLALAAMLLMAATVLVNLAPPNPYLAATLKVWEQGHFLNFNGLTRLVSALWPFIAMGYLVLLAARRGREGPLG